MSNTREALVAAIAASPDDDLPRLVMADWFEENGEPERAEFVRSQVAHGRTAETKPTAPTGAGIRKLFTPFLTAFDPHRPIASRFEFTVATITALAHKPPPFLVSANIRKGFITSIAVAVCRLPDGHSVGAALRSEPVTELSIGTPTADGWQRFTEPELIRVTSLSVSGPEHGWPSDGWRAMAHDPHLGGVRRLALRGGSRGGKGMWGVPDGVLRELVDTPLGQQLAELDVSTEGGERPGLADFLSARLHPLARLRIDGNGAASIAPASALGEALRPDVVHQLQLSNGWMRHHLPDFLRERFGDRLKQG